MKVTVSKAKQSKKKKTQLKFKECLCFKACARNRINEHKDCNYTLFIYVNAENIITCISLG